MASARERNLRIDLVREKPFLTLLFLSAIILVLDLLAKFAGVEIPITDQRSFGGYLSAQRFWGLVWNGFVVGLIIGLGAVGLSMTYSILRFANFSHGDLLTTGAFTGWATAYLVAGFGTAGLGTLLLVRPAGGAPFPTDIGASIVSSPIAIIAGLIIAVGLTIIVALIIDRLVYRPMRDRGGIPLLIASIGVALTLRYVIFFIYGGRTRGVTDPRDVRTDIGPLTVDLHEATLVIAAIGFMIGLHVLLQYTKLGKAMRAMADNKDLALVTGIPTERVVTATWVIGGGLAGAAGYLVVLDRGTMGFNLGWFLLLLIFAAVILGGIGSIYGAIAGGLIIGFTFTLCLIWIPSDFNEAAAFGIMILVLLYRPEGLFSGVTTA